MIYFTSDLHMNNTNVIRYCNRPFADAAEMNEALIDNWNSVVTMEDDVWVLGDFIMGQADTILDILPCLNGNTIHLVPGNHDTPKKMEIYAEYPRVKIEQNLSQFYYKEYLFLLCHYPIVCNDYLHYMLKNNPKTITLFGHVHDVMPHKCFEHGSAFNVGADVTNFTPVSIEQIIAAVEEEFNYDS